MSYAVEKMPVVRVEDPETDLHSMSHFPILHGGQEVTWRPYVAISSSNTNSIFNCPPPNPACLVSRHVLMQMPVTLTFTGNGTQKDNSNLLMYGCDGFRFMPLSQSIQTLTATLNNSSVSINMRDIIEPLLRSHTTNCDKNLTYSLSPSYPDQAQSYQQTFQGIRNPLGNYLDTSDGCTCARGGFVYDSFVNTPQSAVINATLTEPLFLSPFIFNGQLDKGFIGLQNMTLNVSYVNNLDRMWSHDNVNGNVFAAVGGITVQLGIPTLLFKYITPSILSVIPRSINYDYYDIQRYITQCPTFDPIGGARDTLIVQSQNIQLQTVPKKIYFWARKNNFSQTYTDSDCYFSIENISLNYNNRAGLFSSMTKRDIYNLSRKNNVNMSWIQWSGDQSIQMVGTNVSPQNKIIRGPGSILSIEMGTDLGLSLPDAPGVNFFKSAPKSRLVTVC